MSETKDKIITLESLAMLHTYNQNTYVQKTDNILRLIDLNESNLKYNPNDFIGFILEATDNDNEIRQISLTNKASNNVMRDVKTQSLYLDDNGDIISYELYFYLENGEYTTKLSLTKISLSTGAKAISPLSYDKLYGIKIV